MGRHFSGRAGNQVGSSLETRSVVPDDDADLPGGVARALFVGVTGDVVCVDPTGGEFTLKSGSNQYHPLMVARIKATGTTATDILALY